MLNNVARSFVMIMIVLALLALGLRIGVHKIIAYNIDENQLLAQLNLKLLSTALENYAKDNKGVYPVSAAVLTKGEPVYLERDYLAVASIHGYEYDCRRLDAAGYSCAATPVNCKLTGRKVYAVSTGGLIISEECDKK